jgi:hypothetical protein
VRFFLILCACCMGIVGREKIRDYFFYL